MDHKGALPKFTRSKVDAGPLAGSYIIHHNSAPHCVGLVVMEGEVLRVYMRQVWDTMTPVQEQDMCIEMKNWYYFKYVQKSGTKA